MPIDLKSIADAIIAFAEAYGFQQSALALLISAGGFLIAAITSLFTFYARRKNQIKATSGYVYLQSIQFLIILTDLYRNLFPLYKEANSHLDRWFEAQVGSEEEEEALREYETTEKKISEIVLNLISSSVSNLDIPHIAYQGFAAKGKLRSHFYDAMQIARSLEAKATLINKTMKDSSSQQGRRESLNLRKSRNQTQKDQIIEEAQSDLLRHIGNWEKYVLASIRVSGVQLNWCTRHTLWIIFLIEEPLRFVFRKIGKPIRTTSFYKRIEFWTLRENPWWYPFWFWDNFKAIERGLQEAKREYLASQGEDFSPSLINFDQLFSDTITRKLTVK